VYTFYLFIVIYLLLQCIHQDFSSGEASPEESVLGISTQSSPPTFQQEVMLKQSFMHNNMRGGSSSSSIVNSNDNSNPNSATTVPQQQHASEEQALTWCHHMRHRHKVKPGISWGSLSPIDQVKEREKDLARLFVTCYQCFFFCTFHFLIYTHTHTHTYYYYF
jgi:hypothetical protein